jgi:REP element-mobilizing transposase RayT
MARPLRIQYPGAVYHVTCRGNERRDIFRDDEDRTTFLRLLYQSLNIYSVKLYAYVLMSNHFHLLVETQAANLAEFMRHFNITYTGYFNRRHRRVGHLYQGRYKSILVEKEAYLSTLSRYIHLNPIRMKSFRKSSLKEKFEKLLNYPWSSLPGYLEKSRQEAMTDYTLVLADYGGDTKKGRNAYRKQLILDIDESIDVKGEIFGQSILGGDDFINWVKEKVLGEQEKREQPSVSSIRNYQQKEAILAIIERETGKDLAALKNEKGDLRRLAMDLLYRHGGMKGTAIGELCGIDYSAVSQERKRLRERVAHDRELKKLMHNIEGVLTKVKI